MKCLATSIGTTRSEREVKGITNSVRNEANLPVIQTFDD